MPMLVARLLFSLLLLPLLSSAAEPAATTVKPSLTVTTTRATSTSWARTLSANGSIAAWQESVIGAEQGGLRITEVAVDVGDSVKRGALLARLNTATLNAEMAQARAAVAEAQAVQAQARADADRARQLAPSGAIGAAQLNQAITAEMTAGARVTSAQALLQSVEVRLSQARILAPDDGVISSRTASTGSLTSPGQELFRLIRQNRLEWRAEVIAADLAKLKPGQKASLTTPSGQTVQGRVRIVAPSVDARTRTGLVYVDLDPQHRSDARAGMFARGEIDLGSSTALTLPQTAVMLRDGFYYVYRFLPNNRVQQIKVGVGRRVGDRLEITSGIDAGMDLVASGVAFISDGDTVKRVAQR